eukprot:TRINITY_DN2488_c0_g1_i14.p1 TRINITY_DN2488_c0_g1~~TRINITY_DN2488_c0_g1_i14.p1  ORF type:complete len:149 (-),score=17.23 TRINITY_DN2488_c0_g1_i14:117-563(-)
MAPQQRQAQRDGRERKGEETALQPHSHHSQYASQFYSACLWSLETCKLHLRREQAPPLQTSQGYLANEIAQTPVEDLVMTNSAGTTQPALCLNAASAYPSLGAQQGAGTVTEMGQVFEAGDMVDAEAWLLGQDALCLNLEIGENTFNQ